MNAVHVCSVVVFFQLAVHQNFAINFRYNEELRQEIQKLSADLHKHKRAAKVVKAEASSQVNEKDFQAGAFFVGGSWTICQTNSLFCVFGEVWFDCKFTAKVLFCSSRRSDTSKAEWLDSFIVGLDPTGTHRLFCFTLTMSACTVCGDAHFTGPYGKSDCTNLMHTWLGSLAAVRPGSAVLFDRTQALTLERHHGSTRTFQQIACALSELKLMCRQDVGVGARPGSVAESVRAAAEAAQHDAERRALEAAGMVFDNNYGMYYDYNSGYYYDAVRCEPEHGGVLDGRC